MVRGCYANSWQNPRSSLSGEPLSGTHTTLKAEIAAYSVVRDVMPVVGRTPGAAEPLQEEGTGPDRSLDLASKFTRLPS